MINRRAIGAALLLAGGIALFSAAPAYAIPPTPTPIPTPSAPPEEGVCDELDSGKIDVSDKVTSLEISAPDGYVITEYCVKAGSVIHGDGPQYVTVDPPTQTVVIQHESGKDISHYSFSFELAPTTPPTTPPASTPPATTPPATTPAGTTTPTGGGTGLAETGFDGAWLLFAGLGAIAIGSLVVGERLAVRRRRGV
ncbi:hypothetical protein [Agromyces sp. Soil535]|uniref:hypothetical protein n=1 Tax=Agromyces sp. Soil535 TaxID=1736390 RepID=UPI0006F1DC64|nr:hypothetical protein [Agromyces sp. Soil535]KRE25898.1 hypothetical protein ASG80_03420 [Agromyces sp. Soil535]